MDYLTDLDRRKLLHKEKSPDFLDGCKTKKNEEHGMMLDSATSNAGAVYQIQDFKLKAASAVHEWVNDDISLDDGETYKDRINALLIGIVDINDNKEVDADEADAFDVVANFAVNYMMMHGVDEDDASSVLDDEDVADRVRDLLMSELPEDEQGSVNSYAFGGAFLDNSGAGEEILDGVFKKLFAIVGGVKKMVKKRISGVARRSGAQKAALKKAQRKSHSAGAMMKRAKSMSKRVKFNLKEIKHPK